jgi:hypothetical protein
MRFYYPNPDHDLLRLSDMATDISNKFQRELKSFYALSVMNIIFGGIGMALGISAGVQNVLALVEARSLLLYQFALTLIGFLAFGISIRWLLSSVEILDGATDIKDDYEKSKTKLDDENATSLVVKMMAYYRDNRSTIQRLTLLSKIAGICFFVNGIILLINTTNNIILGASLGSILLMVIGTILNLVAGASGIIIPRSFRKYSSVWEYRLEQSTRVERELDKELEGQLK